MKPQITREYEFDAEPGLPEPLPKGERVLWQGTPDWRVIARRVFHIRKVALYFAVMLAWSLSSSIADGDSVDAIARSLAWLVPIFALALGLLALLARWTAGTTVYTLTDKRIVMRIGIVLTVAYNLPLTRIESADVHVAGGGCHDIALVLERSTRIAWLQMWPHARPWHVAKPQPMLRALRDGEHAAALLRNAWAQANGAVAAAAEQAHAPRAPDGSAGAPNTSPDAAQDLVRPAAWGAQAG